MPTASAVDTNVISEARKGGRASRGVTAFFVGAAARDEPVYLSVISSLHLWVGVETMARPQN